MENINVGTFLYKVIEGLVNFTKTLYDVFTTELNISWLNKLIKFFGLQDSLTFPDTISLLWVLTGASGIVILGFIIYNIFKI